MSERESLIAYLATLAAIILLALIAAWMLREGRQIEAFGFAAIMTGLIGTLGTFRPRNTPTANVERAETVNQETKP